MEINNNQNCEHGPYRIPSWIIQSLGVLLVIFVAILIVQKGNDLKNTISNTKPANTISVSGEGKVSATPDLATVTIGVLSQGATAVDVKNQNNDKVKKVTDFIKSQGVAQADITTSQFSFYPQQDWTKGSAVIIGYQGNQSVTVKVHGVDKDQTVLEKILDGSVNNGANQINGVNLTVEKPADLQNQAKKMAIADAKAKAQELAQEAGLSLGKVVSISENGGGYPTPMPYAVNSMAAGKTVIADSFAPDIQNGSQDITETMTVVFEIK